MQRLEVSGAVRHIYVSLGVKGLMIIFAKKNHFRSRLMEKRQKKCSTNFKYTLHRYSVDKPTALLTVNFKAVQRTSQQSVFAQFIQASPSALNVI
jgi:hypothetical protein